MNQKLFKQLLPDEYILKLIQQNIREDNRKFLERR